jgi:hypothetical protein
MSETYPRKSTRSTEYSLQVLKVLIQSKQAGLTAKCTAEALNHADLLTHTGQFWTGEHVRQSLKKIRHRSYNGKLYPAMLQLINSEKLSIPDCLPLFSVRRRSAAHVS